MNIDGTIPLGERHYTPGVGNFGVKVQGMPITWYNCRERFHGYADPIGLREFYFAHDVGLSADVARFIYQLETHLDLVEKSLFKYTDSPIIVWVKVSSWWLKSLMRYAFFTCAIRGALRWNKTTSVVSWLVDHTQYLNATKNATKMFLDGYTFYAGNVRGWYRQFSGYDVGRSLTDAELNALLLRPSRTDRQRHDAVASLARQMWDEAKQPSGKDEEFWFKAAEIIDARR